MNEKKVEFLVHTPSISLNQSGAAISFWITKGKELGKNSKHVAFTFTYDSNEFKNYLNGVMVE